MLKTEHSYQYCEYSRKPREVQQSDNMKPGRYIRSAHRVGWDFYRHWPILTASFSILFVLLAHPASFKLLFLDGTNQCTVKVDSVLIRFMYLFLQSLKRDIERRIDVIPRIICEPQLISDNDSHYILQPGCELPPHYFRLKAVDDIKLLGMFE